MEISKRKTQNLNLEYNNVTIKNGFSTFGKATWGLGAYIKVCVVQMMKEERYDMIKKFVIVAFVLMMMGVTVVGCSEKADKPIPEEMQEQQSGREQNEEQSPSTEYQFDATVLSTENDSMMVEALEGQTVVGEVKVWIGLLDDTEMSEIKAGDTVRITHDGKMTMSIPPQMSAVKLTKISK